MRQLVYLFFAILTYFSVRAELFRQLLRMVIDRSLSPGARDYQRYTVNMRTYWRYHFTISSYFIAL